MKINSIFNNTQDVGIKEYLSYVGVKDIKEYLSCKTIEDLSHYDNIEQGAKLIIDAVKNNKQFVLLLDEDCDGVFSTCIQYMYLKKLNPDLNIKVLFHNENRKAHGLDDREILKLLKDTDKEEEKILWIADASCNDAKEYKMLKKYGYIGLNTDHHNKTTDNPYALIINNHYSDSVENKSLSGAGVTFKLCKEVDLLNGTNYADELISYVHLSNISDSCEFVNAEQNTIRYLGLKNIHPNIQPFIDAFNYNGGLENMDFSFGLVSRFNAVIRVGSLEEKQTLFYSIVNGDNFEDAIAICKKCKTEQDKTRDELLENNIELCHDSNVAIYKINTKTSLTGLIAGKLMSKHNKPVFLLHERESGEVAGSCRSTVDLRSLCEQSGLFNYASGHEKSYGLGYNKDNEEEIFKWIDNLNLPEPTITVLCSCTPTTIPLNAFEEFSEVKYIYGQGIPKPLIHIKNITFKPQDIQLLGKTKRTLKLKHNNVDYMIFMSSNDDKERLGLNGNLNETMTMELVGTLGINEWDGNKYNQIIIDKFDIQKDFSPFD